MSLLQRDLHTTKPEPLLLLHKCRESQVLLNQEKMQTSLQRGLDYAGLIGEKPPAQPLKMVHNVPLCTKNCAISQSALLVRIEATALYGTAT